MPISRRDLTLGGLAVAAGTLVLAACRRGSDTALAPATSQTAPPPGAGSSSTGAGTGATLTPTPSCGDEPTPSQTEGPFFTTGSPMKSDLAADVSDGTKLVLNGTVVTTACEPVKQAKLDFWQADDSGEYDNEGFRLRGHVFTDDQGGYQITTVVPGLYPGRTRHVHVRAQAPGGRALTTQLYFPGEPANADDGLYREELDLAVSDASGGGKQAGFTFVLQA